MTNVIEKDGKTFVEDKVDGLLEVKYGLPPEVHFCSKCVISNQRATPSEVTKDKKESRKNTVPFKDGVCEACRVVESKSKIDWEDREKQLLDLLNRYRSKDGSYDCLIPGSGGKDSAFQAHILKTKYGMNPLTVTWAPHLYTDIGWKNFTNWCHVGGFDNYLFTPDGQVHKKLTSLAYRNMLHPFQPFIYGQRHYAMHMAKRMGINLIFYGEHPSEYGANSGEDQQSLFDPKYYTGDPTGDIYVSGTHIDELNELGISREKLAPYLPLTMDEIKNRDIQVHFLGHFLKWVPQEMYYYAVEHTGFKPSPIRTEGTYSKYNSIDDKLDGFHYWTGFIKFGIGRCTHEAGQEIRHGHLTRDEGVNLVHQFDGEFPKRYFKEICEYMDMSEEEFHEIADSFRSPHLWKMAGNSWVLRHKVS